jgi:hypothetical protein
MKRSLLVVVFIALGMLCSNGWSFAESAGWESTNQGLSAADPSAHTPDFAGAVALTMCLSGESAPNSFPMNQCSAGSSKSLRNPT